MKLLVTLVPPSDGLVCVAEAVVDADALPSVSVAVAETFVSMLVVVPFLLLAVDCPVLPSYVLATCLPC